MALILANLINHFVILFKTLWTPCIHNNSEITHYIWTYFEDLAIAEIVSACFYFLIYYVGVLWGPQMPHLRHTVMHNRLCDIIWHTPIVPYFRLQEPETRTWRVWYLWSVQTCAITLLSCNSVLHQHQH